MFANTVCARRIGPLNRERLETGGGLGIPGSNWLPFMAIHTIGMKFTIDVFFVDPNYRVLGLCTVPPDRVAWVLNLG